MILQFGNVVNPIQILDKSGRARNFDSTGVGLIAFGSGIIRLMIIAAGVFALFNFLTAGIQYISSQGEPKNLEAARNKIMMSVMGLAIIAVSFILSAVVGLLLYGEPLIFIQPSIYTP